MWFFSVIQECPGCNENCNRLHQVLCLPYIRHSVMLDSNLSCYQKDLLFSSLPLKWCTNNRSTHWWNHGYSGNKFYLHHCEFLFIFVVSFIVGMYPASQVVAVALVFRKREGGNGGESLFRYLAMVLFCEKEFKKESSNSRSLNMPLCLFSRWEKSRKKHADLTSLLLKWHISCPSFCITDVKQNQIRTHTRHFSPGLRARPKINEAVLKVKY